MCTLLELPVRWQQQPTVHINMSTLLIGSQHSALISQDSSMIIQTVMELNSSFKLLLICIPVAIPLSQYDPFLTSLSDSLLL